MLVPFIVIGGAAAALCCLVIAAVLSLSHARGWYDEPGDERKIHTSKIPRLGGVGIFVSAMITGIAAVWILDSEPLLHWIAYIAAAGLIHLTGLADDFYRLRALPRLLVQSLAAIVVVRFCGVSFGGIYVPILGEIVSLGWFDSALSAVWIVGVINAVNMIDGMDGLAGGVSLVAILAIAAFAAISGAGSVLILSAAIAGSLLGFLAFNKPPARIFMGDGGSMALGFLISTLPLIAGKSRGDGMPFWLAITFVVIPVFDTFAAMIRRARERRSLISPDKSHLHHKFLSLGFKPPQILGLVLGVAALANTLTLLASPLGRDAQVGLVLAIWAVLTVGFSMLHFKVHEEA